MEYFPSPPYIYLSVYCTTWISLRCIFLWIFFISIWWPSRGGTYCSCCCCCCCFAFCYNSFFSPPFAELTVEPSQSQAKALDQKCFISFAGWNNACSCIFGINEAPHRLLVFMCCWNLLLSAMRECQVEQKNIKFWCRFDNPFPETYLLLSRNSVQTFLVPFFFFFFFFFFSLYLFLFIYGSHYVAFRVMLREISSGMVFFLFFSIRTLFSSSPSLLSLSLSFSRSLALFLYINYSTFWFPRSFFYWVEKRADWFAGRMRGSVCGCNKVGGPQTRRRSKMVAPCALDYFIIFLSHVPALPTMNRVVTNYVMHKRINISGQEEGYFGNYTLCSAVQCSTVLFVHWSHFLLSICCLRFSFSWTRVNF